MIFTFYKARGMSVGSSLVEDDKLELAKSLEELAKKKGVEFILPTDIVAADKFDENAKTQVVAAGDIPDGWMVSDGQCFPSEAGSKTNSQAVCHWQEQMSANRVHVPETPLCMLLTNASKACLHPRGWCGKQTADGIRVGGAGWHADSAWPSCVSRLA